VECSERYAPYGDAADVAHANSHDGLCLGLRIAAKPVKIRTIFPDSHTQPHYCRMESQNLAKSTYTTELPGGPCIGGPVLVVWPSALSPAGSRAGLACSCSRPCRSEHLKHFSSFRRHRTPSPSPTSRRTGCLTPPNRNAHHAHNASKINPPWALSPICQSV